MFKRIVLVGAPGSGKGTIAQLLCQEYGLKHISTGVLFREKIDNSSDPQSLKIKQLLNGGQLIPDDITNELARDEILACIDKKKGFVLDGYPRNLEQAKYLNQVCDIDHVIFFDIDESLLLKRIVGRLSCKKCNQVYNIYLSPPKKANTCDKCGELLFQRKDDNATSFETRIMEYHKKTEPVINFFKNLNKLDTISAGKSIDDVLKQIKQVINVD